MNIPLRKSVPKAPVNGDGHTGKWRINREFVSFTVGVEDNEELETGQEQKIDLVVVGLKHLVQWSG